MQALYPWNAFSSIPSPRHLNTTSWPFRQRISHHGDYGKQKKHLNYTSTIICSYLSVFLNNQCRGKLPNMKLRFTRGDRFLSGLCGKCRAVLRNLLCCSQSCSYWMGQLFNELNKALAQALEAALHWPDCLVGSAQSRCKHAHHKMRALWRA